MGQISFSIRFRRFRRTSGQVLTHVVLLIALMMTLFPFAWMLSSSFKPQTELFAEVPRLIPKTFTLENYQNVWQHTNFPRFFRNSFKIATTVSLLSITT